MATGGGFSQLTECALCLDPFKRPRALPCLHSFCEECLIGHVAHNSGPGRKFRCPNCRAEFTLPREGVSAFPLNYLLVNLQSAIEASENTTSDGKDSEIKSQDAKCSFHPKNRVEKMCKECKRLMCKKCRQCKHASRVVVVTEEADRVKKQYHKHIEQLSSKIDSLEASSKDLAVYKKATDATLDRVTKSIERECSKICDAVQIYKNEIIEDLKQRYTAEGENIRILKHEQKDFQSELDRVMGRILSLIHDESNVEAILNCENIERETGTILKKEVKKHNEVVWDFHPGDTFINHIDKRNNSVLGKLVTKDVPNGVNGAGDAKAKDGEIVIHYLPSVFISKEVPMAGNPTNGASQAQNGQALNSSSGAAAAIPFPTSNLPRAGTSHEISPGIVLRSTFSCARGQDQSANCIRDVSVCEDGSLALITGLNPGKLMLSSQTGQQRRMIGVSGNPRVQNAGGIEVLSGNCLAVSDLALGQIQIYRKDGRHVNTVGKGIAGPFGLSLMATGDLAACYLDKKCVQTFKKVNDTYFFNDLTIREFPDYSPTRFKQNCNLQGFYHPRSVAPFKENGLVVSDCRSNRVYALVLVGKGNKRKYVCAWQYGGMTGKGVGMLDNPIGICTDGQNRVLVADMNNDRIVVLSPAGEFVKELVSSRDGLCKPGAVTLKNNCLVVGDLNGIVRVFAYHP